VRAWLGRLLGRSAEGGEAAPPAAAAPPRPAVRPPPPPAAPVEEEEPFAPYARTLGVEAAPPEPPEPGPEELALAERLLEHFRRNRPGPAAAPSLSLRLLTLVASPRADVGELVRLVSADPALSAGVLTVANSVVHRGVEEIETVRAAVVRLGLEEVARVAGAVGARSLFNPRLRAELAAHGRSFAALFHRALTVAGGAAALALQLPGGRSDRAYLGGMLSDVGKSIALRSLVALGGEPGAAPPAPELAARALERVHLEVGGECHQEWCLPQYLTVIAVRHHDPEVPADPDFVDLHAVRLCGALLDLREPPLAARAARELLQSARALALGPRAVRALDAELKGAALRVSAAFGIEPGR
jgi:HD-like signal output (HDOD) protein